MNLLLLVGWAMLACSSSPEVAPAPADPVAPVPAPPTAPPPVVGLPRGVHELQPGLWLMTGFALANVIAIDAPEGLIIVDTTEGASSAAEALAALRTKTDRPVAAIVLSHGHPDHVFGGRVFLDADADGPGGSLPPVWAHRDTAARIDEVVSVVGDAIHVRSMRMFGDPLSDEEVTSPLGARLRYAPEDIALARPTQTVDGDARQEIAGLEVELLHMPGETEDHLALWLPERGLMLPGDNVYQAFPNLHTIRGTRWRDPRLWVQSLDRMRDLGATLLVPAHTGPVRGAAEIEDVLTAWRDAIQFVHDQSVRGINAGQGPDELAASIRLPPHLEAHPYLQQTYGRVDWSARAVFQGYLGWYDGSGATLLPVSPEERSRRLLAAFSSGASLPEQAQAAFEEGEVAWSAELAAHWLRAEPDSVEARALLAEAYEALARDQVNMNARNWLRTEAAELRGEVQIAAPKPARVPDDLVEGLPIEVFMAAMGPRLRAERVLDTDLAIAFHFTDIDEHWVLHIRRGVAETRRRSPEQIEALNPGVRVRCTASTWKRISVGKINPVEAVAARELEVDGTMEAMGGMLEWFERPAG